jgi:hypothetical protein
LGFSSTLFHHKLSFSVAKLSLKPARNDKLKASYGPPKGSPPSKQWKTRVFLQPVKPCPDTKPGSKSEPSLVPQLVKPCPAKLIGDRRECPLPQELCSPLRFVLQAQAKSCYNNAQPPVRRVSSGRPEKQKLHGTNMAPATAAGVGEAPHGPGYDCRGGSDRH